MPHQNWSRCRAALGARIACWRTATQVIAALQTQAALDAPAPPQRERRDRQTPEHRRVEHSVDREAGPVGTHRHRECEWFVDRPCVYPFDSVETRPLRTLHGRGRPSGSESMRHGRVHATGSHGKSQKRRTRRRMHEGGVGRDLLVLIRCTRTPPVVVCACDDCRREFPRHRRGNGDAPRHHDVDDRTTQHQQQDEPDRGPAFHASIVPRAIAHVGFRIPLRADLVDRRNPSTITQRRAAAMLALIPLRSASRTTPGSTSAETAPASFPRHAAAYAAKRTSSRR